MMETVDTDTTRQTRRTDDGAPDDDLMDALPGRSGFREVWVGGLVIAAVVATLIALFTLTDAAMFRGRYIVTTVVDNAGGIRNGDPVRMRGVNIGRVNGFGMEPEGVAVRLELEDDYPVPADSRVALRSGGVLGGLVAEITPGTSDAALEGGDRLPGHRVDGFLEAADELSGEAEGVLAQMQGMLSDTTVGAVQASATELQTLLSRLSAVVGEQRSELSTLSQRLRGAAEGVERATGPELERSVARLDSLLGRMNQTTASLDRASASLETVLARMERGEGTLGRLSTDESLYVRMSETVENVNLLVQDIRADPRRYINVSVF